MAALWGTAEGVCYLLLARRTADEIQIAKSEWQEDHPTLGYWPKAGFTGRERKWRGHETVYDVGYTFDEQHRRRSPLPPEAAPDQFALFFGDSFTFGQGVEDGETLPSQFAAAAPAYRPYNYGCGGYGPQNLWVQVHRKAFAAEITETRGIAVYTFIEPQLLRATGSVRLRALWGGRLPYLEPTDQGLVFRGLYEEVFPWRRRAARLIMSSQVVQYFKLDWPSEARPGDGQYVARILAESAAQLKATFEEVHLFVLLYPSPHTSEDLLACLAQAGLTVLDYTRLFEEAPPPVPVALADGHPTGTAYGLVAEALARDIARTAKAHGQ
ncbi:MAG: hypothetical protein HYV26_06720 [Candidatus Hydrogenedentes bacterium]|nr:hypothetical protein [Candidatus Hydrogenedentota bacterium]MBI3117151.1 hypothetical protein [Candidatus Hydrogenedentota bacterium]